MYIEELKKILSEAFKKSGYDVEVGVTVSNKPELCDYQCNDVFKTAKSFSENPITLGNKVVETLKSFEEFDAFFKEAVFCPPGFINLKLSNTFINKYLSFYQRNFKDCIMKTKKETIVVDYGGPNVAKPLHVGHMRTTNIGEAVKRLVEYYGHNVITDVHLGDIGLQIGQVIYKVLEDNISPSDLTIDYLDKAYPYMSKLCKEDENIKEKCASITKKLQEGEKLYVILWEKICEISIADMKKSYKKLGSQFDYWYGESHSLKYIDETSEVLKNVIEESDGALVIHVKEDSDKNEMPPLIYRKSDGAYLYGTTDLATIYMRKKEFNADRIIYVTDLRQNLHFKQVFRASDKGGLFPSENLEHLGYGTANGEDNKPYKTRSGESPKLSELINDTTNIFMNKREENKNLSEEDLLLITRSILKYADLQTTYEKDYIFDLNKFSDVTGKTGPYLLYTYLRINKILKSAEYTKNLSDNIYNEHDLNLRLMLLESTKLLDLAYSERKPNYICDYLYNLAASANLFYTNNAVLSEEDIIKKNDYLNILDLTNFILKDYLNILGIDIPSEM